MGILLRTKADSSRKNLKKAIQARKERSWRILNCTGCGKVCNVRMASIRKGWKYCSWECRKKNMVGSCGPNAGGGAWMKGVNNINYKHGRGYDKIRHLGLVNIWRRRVFQRDKFICQRCGYDQGRIIQAHHVIPWIKSVEHRFLVSNGITLCVTCHRWVHSRKNEEKAYLSGVPNISGNTAV